MPVLANMLFRLDVSAGLIVVSVGLLGEEGSEVFSKIVSVVDLVIHIIVECCLVLLPWVQILYE